MLCSPLFFFPILRMGKVSSKRIRVMDIIKAEGKLVRPDPQPSRCDHWLQMMSSHWKNIGHIAKTFMGFISFKCNIKFYYVSLPSKRDLKTCIHKSNYQQVFTGLQLSSGTVIGSVSYPGTVRMHPCHSRAHIHPCDGWASTDLAPTAS